MIAGAIQKERRFTAKGYNLPASSIGQNGRPGGAPLQSGTLHPRKRFGFLLSCGGLLTRSAPPPSADEVDGGPELEQRVRGVLITALDYSSDRLRRLPERGVPVILVDRAPVDADDWCTVGVEDVEGAYDRIVRSDVKYRFVIDLATLKAA